MPPPPPFRSIPKSGRGFAEFLRTAVANEVVAHKDAQKSVRKSLAAHEATLAKEVQAKAAHLKRVRPRD